MDKARLELIRSSHSATVAVVNDLCDEVERLQRALATIDAMAEGYMPVELSHQNEQFVAALVRIQRHAKQGE